MSDKLEQLEFKLEFKLEKILGFRNVQGKVRKRTSQV